MSYCRKFMQGLICVLLALGVAASLKAQMQVTSVDSEKQIITLALAQEPPQLNSMKATDQVSIFVLSHVMEGLVRYDRRGNVVPGVAERWEITEDKATFWLRKNALWSDGIPVKAQDFIFAWRNALAPATASEYAFILYPIKNAEAINRGEMKISALAAKALDDYTIELEFERPTGYFLKLLAFPSYFPVREDFHNSRGAGYAAEATDLLYNGPFKMTEWVHSASLKMIKNQQYWDKDSIHLNAIHSDYITTDSRARLNLFKDGKIAYTVLDGETYKDALTQKLRIRSFTTGSVFYLGYNYRPGHPTRNLNLRKAIQSVFDPHEFVNKVLATPGNLPGESLFPVWLQGVERKFRMEYPAPKVRVDIQRGRSLIEMAKSELGVDEIPPLIYLVSDSPTAIKQAEYMQGHLKNTLGLDIKIDIQTFKQRLAKMTNGDYDIVGAGWGPDFDDVMTFGDLFTSWNLNNRGRYSNPELDDQVRIAMNSMDPKTRMDAMGRVQEILFEQAVILPQYEQGVIYVIHGQLKGMVRRVVGADPDFTYARVIEPNP